MKTNEKKRAQRSVAGYISAADIMCGFILFLFFVTSPRAEADRSIQDRLKATEKLIEEERKQATEEMEKMQQESERKIAATQKETEELKQKTEEELKEAKQDHHLKLQEMEDEFTFQMLGWHGDGPPHWAVLFALRSGVSTSLHGKKLSDKEIKEVLKSEEYKNIKIMTENGANDQYLRIEKLIAEKKASFMHVLMPSSFKPTQLPTKGGGKK